MSHVWKTLHAILEMLARGDILAAGFWLDYLREKQWCMHREAWAAIDTLETWLKEAWAA